MIDSKKEIIDKKIVKDIEDFRKRAMDFENKFRIPPIFGGVLSWLN